MTTKTPDEPAARVEMTDLVTGMLGIHEDVEAMVASALLEAAEGCREDLKAIMTGVKAINAAKQRQREVLARMQRDATEAALAEAEGRKLELSPNGLGGASAYARVQIAIPDVEATGGVRFATVAFADRRVVRREEIEAARDAIRGQLDSLSELGEMESLRLQMAMDRLSKLMSTLSNVLKKMSDTGQTITQNLK